MKPKFWHTLFETGVTLKALNSVWETVAGLLLLTRVHTLFTNWLVWLTRAEFLGVERRIPLAHFVSGQAEHLSAPSTRIFVGAYLLFHGIVNAFMAYYLFRNRLWAYPAAIVFVSLFFVYQLYRLVHTHSLILLAVSLFDIAFIILTWHEYQHQMRVRAPHKPAKH